MPTCQHCKERPATLVCRVPADADPWMKDKGDMLLCAACVEAHKANCAWAGRTIEALEVCGE